MLTDRPKSVYNDKHESCIDTHACAGFSPSPLNYTPVRQCITLDSQAFQTFRDALRLCCICNDPHLHPHQAVIEFREKFKTDPPPRYFREWRSCWAEFDITPEKVATWLEKVDRQGWIDGLGGAA